MSSEAVVQQRARLEHLRVPGSHNWRNNSGACFDETGRLIRYGLGHENKMKDDDPRSVDIIGITPTLIQPHMVGYYLGVFTAFEVKPSNWTLRPGDARAQGQDKWMRLVRDACGYAGFVTQPSDVYRIIGRDQG